MTPRNQKVKCDMNRPAKRMGRPPTDTEAINLRLPANIIIQIDALRREEADIPTRPEMIRRLLQAKLDEISPSDD
jgi:hypothetical protein